jgi:hypothetical protein
MSKSIAAGLCWIAGFLWASLASAHPRDAVQVEIVDAAQGTELAQFRQASHAEHIRRAYLAANRGQRYSIRVRNLRGTRIGVVIAVDGRNIITGARSDLKPTERMYILEPWQTANYSGWRADLSSVNEFYFTDWPDSYSAAFGDASAQGVIAVAVYDEMSRAWFFSQSEPRMRDEASGASKAAPAAPPPVARSAERAQQAAAEADSAAGTGYGERVVEAVREVHFDVNPQERARVLIKYEWRDQLCSKYSLACEPANRLWDENRSLGFAPPPPPRRGPAS